MKIAFALPGFHAIDRGAEVALISVAKELAAGGDAVTLFGSGPARPGMPYDYVRVPAVPRERFERFPKVPPFRSETGWEDATFALGLMRSFEARDFDLSVTCSYPFTNWALRRAGGRAVRHVFVTQNGDWPAVSDDAEFRWFGCDGLVCTNPDYLANCEARWTCALIPNGMDPARFSPGPGARASFGLPPDRPVVLMVSACIDTKRVEDGIRAVAQLPDAFLIVAGDGPLRERVQALADQLLPGRFALRTIPNAQMPLLYRSADAFLHMSLVEAFGNVFVEAMACGVPVVGHDTPRLRWIVGADEYLVDTADATATAAAIARALAAGREGAAQRVDKAAAFAWPNIARQYRTFFETL
jgi:glycosyltransferase involved in cell wall biosynthesis